MEFVLRPTVLAFVAGVVFATSVGVLVDKLDEATPTIDDATGLADGVDADGDGVADVPADGTDADGDGVADVPAEGTDADGDGVADGNGTDATGDDGTTDGDGTEATGSDGSGVTALRAPAAGTYTYATSGSFSLTGDGETALPATSSAVVTSTATGWDIEIKAGDDYADRFGFDVGADGMQWVVWDLDRRLQGQVGTTAYVCTGDAPIYVAAPDAGRTTSHGCTTRGVSSAGDVVYQGSETVTLGDGTEVTADRLVYDYVVSGDSVTGQGRLELWVDRETGMRVREVRAIESTTSGTFVYREDAQFVLASLTPTA